MIPVNITKTSAPSYKAGTYFDALEPLTAANCNGTQFMQIDTSASIQIGDAQVSIIKKSTKAPSTPNVVLNSEFNNWNMVQRFCGGGYCAAESYGTNITKTLNDHKVSVYKAWPGGSTPWTTYQLPYSIGSIYVGWGDATGLGQIPWASLTKPTWAYVHDEPKYYDFNEVISKLSNWKMNYPSVKRMVTTSIRARDFNPSSPNFGKVVDLPAAMRNDTDIFTPVAEAFCQETWKGSGDFYPCKDAYAGKELWLYISNMSHGAEDGSSTGAPDIMIDRGAVEMFGFYLMAIKYDLSNLLYYNTIQNWEVVSQNLVSNPYIFGGNGDGLLLYPDTKNKNVFTSIRLKLIREASNWADIVIAAGLQSKAKALMTNTLTWNRDLSAFEALRTEALAALP